MEAIVTAAEPAASDSLSRGEEGRAQRFVLDLLSRLVPSLGQTIGKHCEIVLHDLNRPENSIVAIANNHITGRKVGDSLDVLGLQLLRERAEGDLLNYETKTGDGRVLRSSSFFLRDEAGAIFGALCFNFDISAPLQFQGWLQETIGALKPGIDERFEHSVDEVLERLIQTALAATGKPTAELNRAEKISVVAQLESKGAFLIRYSVDRVAELLSLSKYTIYTYLEEIKAGKKAEK